MSTTPSLAAPSPTGPPPSSPSYTNASTLLFGFLVSALSIFAAFMSFAILWNRLVVRRRAIEEMLAAGSRSAESPRVRQPMMWDIWIMPRKQPHPWTYMKPLAAQRCEYPPHLSRSTQTEQAPSFWSRHPWNRLPPEIIYLFHRPIPTASFASSASNDTDVSQVELLHGSDIQVSLLIAMPHSPQPTQGRMHKNHEIVFATMNVIYHDPPLVGAMS